MINASDEDKTTDEEEKAHSITAIGISKSKILFKTLVLTNVFFVDFYKKSTVLFL
ncbi:hypothetical protein [Staphylococcus aureus]|uniref:hypothetical protein n=1 Tax=Staphylococcus aureus TaxID=1280 RepID=UPI000AD26C23|nr:hypothetical protein [Staphylococcus aureus]